jgi:hypothetical protein
VQLEIGSGSGSGSGSGTRESDDRGGKTYAFKERFVTRDPLPAMRIDYVCKWNKMEEVRRGICIQNEAKYRIGRNAGESRPVEPEPPTFAFALASLGWAR